MKEPITNIELRKFLTHSQETELRDRIILSARVSLSMTPTRGAKKFIDCEFVDGGIFEGLDLAGDLTFENCVFKGGELKFKKVTRGKLIFRHSNYFQCKLILEDLRNSETEIGGQFLNDLVISRGDCRLSVRGPGGGLTSSFKNITLTSSHEFKYVLFRDLKQAGKITFHKAVSDNINFAQGEYDVIQFHNTFDLKELKFGSIDSTNKFTVNSISLPHLNLTGKLDVINAEIEHLLLSNLNVQSGDLLLKNVLIGNIDLSTFNMKNGSFRFQNIEFKESFKASQSNLERVQFIGVNFYKAKLYLDWTILSEAFYSNILWPEKYVIYPDLVNKNYAWRVIKQLPKAFSGKRHLSDKEHVELKIQREIYRQLKVISQKNVNNVDALIFYKNEMRVYWTDMRFKSEITGWDHFLIFLNRYISNFGQSYVWPLIFLIVFHFIFYSCILNWNYLGNNWSGSEEFGQFWYLLNPVHKTPDYINTGWGHFTEFVMRVMGGFFIYHFIKATRKFGKV